MSLAELHVVQTPLLPHTTHRPYVSLGLASVMAPLSNRWPNAVLLQEVHMPHTSLHNCAKDADLNTMPKNKPSLSTQQYTAYVRGQKVLNERRVVKTVQWDIRGQKWWFTDMCSGLCREHMDVSVTACPSSRKHMAWIGLTPTPRSYSPCHRDQLREPRSTPISAFLATQFRGSSKNWLDGSG